MGIRTSIVEAVEQLACRLDLAPLGGRIPAQQPQRLVFVCTGNICRSAYAEAVARAHGLPAISAGIATTPGLPANPQAIAEARNRGIDLSGHRTTAWQDIGLQPGDVVLPAQLRHLLAIRSRALGAGCGLVLMSRFGHERFVAVRDPYGRDDAVFRQVFDDIDWLVQNMARYWSEAA